MRRKWVKYVVALVAVLALSSTGYLYWQHNQIVTGRPLYSYPVFTPAQVLGDAKIAVLGTETAKETVWFSRHTKKFTKPGDYKAGGEYVVVTIKIKEVLWGDYQADEVSFIELVDGKLTPESFGESIVFLEPSTADEEELALLPKAGWCRVGMNMGSIEKEKDTWVAYYPWIDFLAKQGEGLGIPKATMDKDGVTPMESAERQDDGRGEISGQFDLVKVLKQAVDKK